MKSLTIYLNEDDFKKVKEIAKEEQTSISQWYRQLTQYGFYLHKMEKAEPVGQFTGMPENF